MFSIPLTSNLLKVRNSGSKTNDEMVWKIRGGMEYQRKVICQREANVMFITRFLISGKFCFTGCSFSSDNFLEHCPTLSKHAGMELFAVAELREQLVFDLVDRAIYG